MRHRDPYYLIDDHENVIAHGSYDAIRAAARLLLGTSAIQNRFEAYCMRTLNAAVAADIDREILGRLP